VAVISVGKGNSIGHPDQGTVSTLQDAGEAVVRTDESGWVSFRVTDGVISAAAERNQAP
jgi:beta-lactamase superfamily II metal-dependent hydrolase